jgi:hypothetical protein
LWVRKRDQDDDEAREGEIQGKISGKVYEVKKIANEMVVLKVLTERVDKYITILGEGVEEG